MNCTPAQVRTFTRKLTRRKRRKGAMKTKRTRRKRAIMMKTKRMRRRRRMKRRCHYRFVAPLPQAVLETIWSN